MTNPKEFVIKGDTVGIMPFFNRKLDLGHEGLKDVRVLIFCESYAKGKISQFNQRIILTPGI